MASRSSAPTNQNDAIAQLKGHTEGIEGIQKLREANKTSPNFTFLSAISESIPALGWVCVVSFNLLNMVSLSIVIVYIILCKF